MFRSDSLYALRPRAQSAINTRRMPVSDDVPDPLEAAWADFCGALREKGEQVLGPAHGAEDDAERAQALRYLLRSAVFALQSRVEFSDPDFPKLYRSPDDRTVWGGPNVYFTYAMVPVRGDAIYELRGEIGNRDALLGRDLFTFSPNFQSSDGAFDVRLSAAADDAGGNWIALAPGMHPDGTDVVGEEDTWGHFPGMAGHVLLKIVYGSADTAPSAWMHVERVDEAAPLVPEQLTADRLEKQLRSAGRLVGDMVDFYGGYADKLRSISGTNALYGPVITPVREAKPDISAETPLLYSFACFDLGPDEALLIEAELPQDGYWNVQLQSRWLESLDFQNRQTTLDRDEVFIDTDGMVRGVVAHRDPGCPNWLDTEGYRRGVIYVRWIGAEAARNPNCRVIRAETVRDHLPADHPVVTPADRRITYARRREYFSRRFQQS